MQLAVAENFRAQTAAAFQELLRARSNDTIHPVARAAFLYSVKKHTLNFELLRDQSVKVDSAGNHIAPRRSRRAIVKLQRNANFLENFQREKSDLTFIIVFEIKVPITGDPTPGHALDLRKFNHGMRVRVATVVADEIVRRRNVQVTDFHRRNNI